MLFVNEAQHRQVHTECNVSQIMAYTKDDNTTNSKSLCIKVYLMTIGGTIKNVHEDHSTL